MVHFDKHIFQMGGSTTNHPDLLELIRSDCPTMLMDVFYIWNQTPGISVILPDPVVYDIKSSLEWP